LSGGWCGWREGGREGGRKGGRERRGTKKEGREEKDGKIWRRSGRQER
jgi:hypothetical protein